MTKFQILQIITGCIGSLGFAILYNIRGKRLIVATLGGFLSWALFVVLGWGIPSEPVNYFLVAFSMSLYAEAMARLLKTPTTTFITTSLIPLIPGGSLYYTMSYAFESDLEKFVEKAIDTLQLASALALGIIVATTMIRLLTRCLHKKPQKRRE